MNAADLLLEVLQDAFWSGLAALGFAILFNVPKHTLIGCVLCGALGHALRSVLMQFGLAIEAATLIAATIVGFLSVYCARRFHTPAAIFAVCGAIPLVPGAFAYRTMIGILQISMVDPAEGAPVLVETSVNAIKTGLILATIAFGIAAPSLLFNRRKPVA